MISKEMFMLRSLRHIAGVAFQKKIQLPCLKQRKIKIAWTKLSENAKKSNEWRKYKQELEIQKETGKIFNIVHLAKIVLTS